jgi:hypothetical protein
MGLQIDKQALTKQIVQLNKILDLKEIDHNALKRISQLETQVSKLDCSKQNTSQDP